MARAYKIRRLTAEHYEPGNQSKCYYAIWRVYVEPEFGICYKTYLRYLGIDPEKAVPDRGPTLFDG